MGDNTGLPDEELAVYDNARYAFLKSVAELIPKGDEPNVVAKVIVTAATTAKPKLRYTAGPLAGRLAILRRFVPESMFDSSLRKQMKLD